MLFFQCTKLVRVCVLCRFSHVQLFVALRTAAHRVSLFIGFSMQEYWNGLPCPPPGDLPNPGTKPDSLTSWQVDSLPLAPPGNPTPNLGLPPNHCLFCALHLDLSPIHPPRAHSNAPFPPQKHIQDKFTFLVVSLSTLISFLKIYSYVSLGDC